MADQPRQSDKHVESDAGPETDTSLSHIRGLIERYAANRGSLQRSYGVPMSALGMRRFRQFYRNWQGILDDVAFDGLSQQGRIDYLLLRNQLRHELQQLAYRKQRDTEVAGLIPFWETIVTLAENRRQMQPIEAAKAAQQLADLGQQVRAARRKVEAHLKAIEKEKTEAEFKPTIANRAVSRIDGLRRVLRNWYGFYHGYHPEFTWWTKSPYEQVDRDLEAYAAFLRQRLVDARVGQQRLVGDPIGRKALLRQLAYEMIPYSPEELIEIAQREFAWCEAEMRRASRELGYGDQWRKALEHVKQQHVEPGRQPQLIVQQALEAIAFLEKHDLVTIPALCRETWRMEMMPPERQKVNPYFTGGEVIRVSFPTDTMTHQQKLMSMRGNNVHFSRATVHHELIPGHHLQGFMAARYCTHRRVFRTPFLVEGWALYWEMLLWDLDFARSAEDRVGMLFWRMHRCARIIFSLSYHLQQMTADEAVEFLVTRVGHERNNAVAEVRRSIGGQYGPLYQAAYMLGGLQIRALRGELVESGNMTERQFHDAILKENAIPIELIRASLSNQQLRRDTSSNWRFDQ